MDVIEATFVKVGSTLADGTLRLVFDVEPRYAQAAFSLFHSPGTTAALARLNSIPIPAVTTDNEIIPDKVGTKCIQACQLCKDPQFLIWSQTNSEEEAKNYILSVCNISSRKELDTNSTASHLFISRILIPFNSKEART